LDEEASKLRVNKKTPFKYLHISGEIEMQNSFGYLSAETYPLLKFYIGMAVAYFFIDIVWVFLCFKYYDNLILLHHFLSMILLT
jgi:hypothetical protein